MHPQLTPIEIENTKRLLAESESLYKTVPELFTPLFEAGELTVYAKQEIIMHPGQ